VPSDLFPGFESLWINGLEGKIFARVGGSGDPVILLHGFPQTHACWRFIAPRLAKTHRVIVPDLRGYGWSTAPRSEQGARYSKRAMGEDILAILEELSEVRAVMIGHDRGARLAYRFALDHPGRVSKLTLLDILPTFHVWRMIEAGRIPAAHWGALAMPAPGPENEIAKGPEAYIDTLMAKWTKSGSLKPFAGALDSYHQSANEPSRIHAFCEDYRAGATLDRMADEADLVAGKTITCPVQLLWGDFYLTKTEPDIVGIWRNSFAPTATGQMIDAGHFLAEEAPDATLSALEAFLVQTNHAS
jgi:haloacetate dehalogenase